MHRVAFNRNVDNVRSSFNGASECTLRERVLGTSEKRATRNPGTVKTSRKKIPVICHTFVRIIILRRCAKRPGAYELAEFRVTIEFSITPSPETRTNKPTRLLRGRYERA